MEPNEVIDKKALVAACQAGDREAQGLLYTTYRRKMMKVIRQYVADHDMAQDVMHDGFLIILSQIQSLRNPESLDYWMATIMKNLAIHTLSQIDLHDIIEGQEELEEETDIDLSYEELMTLIEHLPNGYQTVFRLAVLEGKSHQEIADMLGISPKSSASQLARAKAKLRMLITEHMKKTGLLAILLCAAGITYLYLRSKEGKDVVRKNVFVKNNKKNYETEGQHISDEHATSNATDVLPKSNVINVMSKTNINTLSDATDSILIASDGHIDNATQCEAIDSAGQRNDTTIFAPQKELVAPSLYAEKDDHRDLHPHNEKWSVTVTTNALGIGSESNKTNSGNGPMADFNPDGGNDDSTTEETTSVRHLMPLTFGVRISKEFSPKWGIEAGVQYSLLRTDITKAKGVWSNTRNVKAQYISIPITTRYHLLQWKKTHVYTLAGMSLDIPVGASIDNETTGGHSTLYYPVSFSLDAGVGFECQLSPTVSLFIQPTMNYHIMKNSEYPILWQDKPLSFDLPIGIRISW